MSKEIMREKQRYSVLSNYCHIYNALWEYDKRCVICAITEVILGVAVSFGMVWMSAYVVRMLERDLPIAAVLVNILVAFLVFGMINGAASYFEVRNYAQYIKFRCFYMGSRIYRKNMEIDYCQLKNPEIRKLKEKGNEAFWGNNWGMEGILHNDVVMMKAFLGLLLYAGLISGVSPWIVFMLIGISVVQIASFKLVNKYEMQQKDKKAELDITRNYLDRQAFNVAVGKDVRLYQLQNWLGSQYAKANKVYRKIIAKERGRYFANDLFGLFLQLARDVVCYAYLIRRLQNGMAASEFVLYIGVVAGFSAYFSEITSIITETLRFHKSVSFYREFCDLKSEFHHGDGIQLSDDGEAWEVEFSHVSFSYGATEEVAAKKVLDDVSFKLKRGEKLALVGVNGAGKSTIVKLICGFYKPDSGHIYVNGIDVSELDLDEYYKSLAVIFQDAFIFSLTIADNVTGSVDAKYQGECCRQALKEAGLWEKIAGLPKEEKTYIDKYVEEDGIRLSGGQEQRLLLARALYKGCKLLLLDEPTAALDAIAENEMYENYNKMLAGKTALFISHRLASTRFCDNILFLENGKIVEQGTHDALMQLHGQYAQMFEVQSQYYKEERA